MEFRKLRADEIEARVATVTANGCSVLLYKNARCDMKILDETVGKMNWQRDHKDLKGNMYAGISIYDREKMQWVTKWDCGTESYTEAEKGEASDSFKRAGFNWGIGRELYTAPFIWFKKGEVNLEERNGRATTRDTFEVTDIDYKDDEISYLQIYNRKTEAVFSWGSRGKKITPAMVETLKGVYKGENYEKLLASNGITKLEDMALETAVNIIGKLNRSK